MVEPQRNERGGVAKKTKKAKKGKEFLGMMSGSRNEDGVDLLDQFGDKFGAKSSDGEGCPGSLGPYSGELKRNKRGALAEKRKRGVKGEIFTV